MADLFNIFLAIAHIIGFVADTASKFFFFPNILATMSYRRLLTKNNNQEMHIKVTVNEKEIIVENNLSKQKDKYSIEDVKKIT